MRRAHRSIEGWMQVYFSLQAGAYPASSYAILEEHISHTLVSPTRDERNGSMTSSIAYVEWATTLALCARDWTQQEEDATRWAVWFRVPETDYQLSPWQIAKIMGTSEREVIRLLTSARDKFAEQLKRREILQ